MPAPIRWAGARRRCATARRELRSAEPQADVQNDRLAWNLGNLDPGVEKRIQVEIQPGPDGEVTITPTATFMLAKPCRVRIVRPPFAVTQTVAETAPARAGDVSNSCSEQ